MEILNIILDIHWLYFLEHRALHNEVILSKLVRLSMSKSVIAPSFNNLT